VGLRMSRCEFLYPIIAESPYLKSLNISNNTIPRGGLWPLLSNMMQSTTLKYINLSYCNFMRTGIKILAQLLRYSISLLDVDLSYVTMEDPKRSVAELFLGLADSQTIQALHLGGVGNILNVKDLNLLERDILEVGETPSPQEDDFGAAAGFKDAESSGIAEESVWSKDLNGDLMVEESPLDAS
jgi:hypothetical protein